MKVYTVAEWKAEAIRLFGKDGDVRGRDLKFKCAKCGTVQSGQEFLDACLNEDEIVRVLGFSCIGRYVPDKGCDWTLGGFFAIHKVEVVDDEGTHYPYFEFAVAEPEPLPPGRKLQPDVKVYNLFTKGIIRDGNPKCDHDFPPEPQEDGDTYATWACTRCERKVSYEVYQ